MLKILKPSKNRITQGYSNTHPAYDFSGRGELNVTSPLFGTVVQCKNSETRNWIANTKTDPWFVEGKTRKLRTEDYGNYAKLRHQIDGKTFFTLYAHMKNGSVASVGTEIKKGQTLGMIDTTGNSTAAHLHFEVRDENDKNIDVEFVDEESDPKPIMEDKRQQIIDLYKACTGEYPNDDEISLRLQQNKNRVELIEDLLKNDGRSKIRWMAEWGLNGNIDHQEAVDNYKVSYDRLKELLRLKGDATSEEILGAVSATLNRITELQKIATPQTIYKLEGKEFEKAFSIGNLALIIEKLQKKEIGG